MNLTITGLKVDMGGEGSKGGKVIGHTKSGKPVYEDHKHPGHKDFSKNEHLEAARKHEERYEKMGSAIYSPGSNPAAIMQARGKARQSARWHRKAMK